jgi:small subunit ribosomal protein S35
MLDWRLGKCHCYPVCCGAFGRGCVANDNLEFAKPFVPPTVDQPLRFRYTTYMGEQHPAEKKIVMEFCTRDMRDLSPVQRSKLQKIAGVRYNPETDIVRMSCESFPSQAQNKRYLGDLVNNMLREARVCDQPS